MHLLVIGSAEDFRGNKEHQVFHPSSIFCIIDNITYFLIPPLTVTVCKCRLLFCVKSQVLFYLPSAYYGDDSNVPLLVSKYIWSVWCLICKNKRPFLFIFIMVLHKSPLPPSGLLPLTCDSRFLLLQFLTKLLYFREKGKNSLTSQCLLLEADGLCCVEVYWVWTNLRAQPRNPCRVLLWQRCCWSYRAPAESLAKL